MVILYSFDRDRLRTAVRLQFGNAHADPGADAAARRIESVARQRRSLGETLGDAMKDAARHRRAYSSAGLSVGFAQAAFVSSEAGRLTAVFVGGIGFMNHLS